MIHYLLPYCIQMELHPWWEERDRWFLKDYDAFAAEKILLFLCREIPKRESPDMKLLREANELLGYKCLVEKVSEIFTYKFLDSPHCAIKWNGVTKTAQVMDLSHAPGTALSKNPVPSIDTGKMTPENPFETLDYRKWIPLNNLHVLYLGNPEAVDYGDRFQAPTYTFRILSERDKLMPAKKSGSSVAAAAAVAPASAPASAAASARAAEKTEKSSKKPKKKKEKKQKAKEKAKDASDDDHSDSVATPQQSRLVHSAAAAPAAAPASAAASAAPAPSAADAAAADSCKAEVDEEDEEAEDEEDAEEVQDVGGADGGSPVGPVDADVAMSASDEAAAPSAAAAAAAAASAAAGDSASAAARKQKRDDSMADLPAAKRRTVQ